MRATNSSGTGADPGRGNANSSDAHAVGATTRYSPS